MFQQTNQRNDQYSADHKDNALRFLKRIVDEIKRQLPADFVLGVKVNSADYVDSQSTEDAVLGEQRITEHILSIAQWDAFDFIEISGGDYETPSMSYIISTLYMPITYISGFMAKSRRQAFFSHFSHHIMEVLDSLPSDTQRPRILLTGGLRSPSILCNALSSRHADLLGIGRASLLRPDLPVYLQELCDTSNIIDDPTIWDSPFEREPELGAQGISGWLWNRFPRMPLISAGVQMAWYGHVMRRLGGANASSTGVRLPAPDYKLGAFTAVIKFWLWTLKKRNVAEDS